MTDTFEGVKIQDVKLSIIAHTILDKIVDHKCIKNIVISVEDKEFELSNRIETKINIIVYTYIKAGHFDNGRRANNFLNILCELFAHAKYINMCVDDEQRISFDIKYVITDGLNMSGEKNLLDNSKKYEVIVDSTGKNILYGKDILYTQTHQIVSKDKKSYRNSF